MAVCPGMIVLFSSTGYILYLTDFGSPLDGGVVSLMISLIYSVCLFLNVLFLNVSLNAE